MTNMGRNQTQYDSIPDGCKAEVNTDVEVNRGAELSVDPQRRFPVSLVGLLCIFGVCATIFMGFAVSTNGRDEETLSRQSSLIPSNVPIRGSAFYVRPCSFTECFDTGCDAATAPYTCLFHNGGPHGGCSAVKWTPETCDSQCDLSNCASVAIPDDVDTCKGKICGSDWCAGGQVCPDDVPYQCMNGSARFGCSVDQFQWSFKSSWSTCSECCDASTCD